MSREGPLRLLLLGSQMAAGGAQHILLAQATWFRNQGYHVAAAFFYDKECVHTQWQARYAIDIIDLKGWRAGAGITSNLLRLLCAIYRLVRLISRERFDAVETFTHHANLLGLPIAWFLRVPKRVGTHHGRPHMGPGLGRLHTYLANASVMTHLVVVSEHLREEAIGIERIRPEKVSVIANGIDGYGWDPAVQSAARRIRSELKVPISGRLVLSVGRLIPEKGHMHLIEAMPAVLERFPDTIVVIAGDGPLRDALQRRAHELTLGNNVRLLGTRSDVHCLLAAADLFAYPSVRDGCPLALLEALSMQVPIVASTFEGAKGVLEHEKTALLVPAGDTKAFAAALVRALGSPELRRELALAGANLVVRKFSMRTMCQRYDQLFRAPSTIPA